MAITYTQAQLDALNAILLTGAGEVQIGDKKITYRDQYELIRLIKMIEQSLSGSATSSTQPSLIQATFRKGRS